MAAVGNQYMLYYTLFVHEVQASGFCTKAHRFQGHGTARGVPGAGMRKSIAGVVCGRNKTP